MGVGDGMHQLRLVTTTSMSSRLIPELIPPSIGTASGDVIARYENSRVRQVRQAPRPRGWSRSLSPPVSIGPQRLSLSIDTGGPAGASLTPSDVLGWRGSGPTSRSGQPGSRAAQREFSIVMSSRRSKRNGGH
jgi:hypothetical protein